MTRSQMLLEYFDKGGLPVTARDIAKILDITVNQASKLITNVERCGKYEAGIRNITHEDGFVCREIFYMVALGEPRTARARATQKRCEEIKAYILRNPTATIYAITSELKCGVDIAERTRADLVAKGLVPKSTEKRERVDKQWVKKNRPIHPDDIPHMQRAAKFREIWPTWRRGNDNH